MAINMGQESLDIRHWYRFDINGNCLFWDSHYSLFSSTQHVLKGKLCPLQWVQDEGTFNSQRRIVHQNLQALLSKEPRVDELTDLQRYADVMNAMTLTDHSVKETETFMVLPAHRTHFALQVVWSLGGAQKDVPVLHLNPDPLNGSTKILSSDHSNSVSTSFARYDIPAILGGKRFEYETWFRFFYPAKIFSISLF